MLRYRSIKLAIWRFDDSRRAVKNDDNFGILASYWTISRGDCSSEVSLSFLVGLVALSSPVEAVAMF